MKYVNFRRVAIQNFLSVGHETVEVEFKKGLHIITGANKDKPDRQNAIGKSTIADAIYFAIFGTSLRELKKDLIINNITNATCAVELEFSIASEQGTKEYVITRCLNPSKCILMEDGVDITRDSIANTTIEICNLINATPSIFKNCVIMTLNDTVPFMAQNKVEKRKFIEGIFNLEVFTKMLGHVREEYNENKKTYDIELAAYEGYKSNVANYEQQKSNVLKSRKDKQQVYKQRQTDNQMEMQRLMQSMNDIIDIDVDKLKSAIEQLNDGAEKCQNNVDQHLQHVAVTQMSCNNLTLRLRDIDVNGTMCNKCLRPITQHDVQHIAQEKQNLQQQIDECKTNIAQAQQKLEQQKHRHKEIKKMVDAYKDKINKYNVAAKEKEGLQDRINQLQTWCTQLSNDIEQLNNDDTEFDELIQDMKVRIDNVEQSINKQRSLINMLDVVKYIACEEGVKSFIVKKILQLLNSKLAAYLDKMDANCVCKFNEYFEEEIVNDKGKICSYFNFSGAERKSIDLACLFSFIDIRRMQGDVVYNLTIYDELFDSSLDTRGVDMVIDIIKERVEKNNECALVISHRKESIKAATGEIIYLEKHNGITRRASCQL